jgi:hypothetical protein
MVQSLFSIFSGVPANYGNKPPMDSEQVIKSLVEQLHSLYAERESQNGGYVPSSDQHVLVETVRSLEEQLSTLYQEKEGKLDGDSSTDALRSMEQQLIELYQERDLSGNSLSRLSKSLESMEQQLVALYAEKQEQTPSATNAQDEALTSLEAQLKALYEEKEQLGENSSLHASLKSLEEQLVSLYAERERSGTVPSMGGAYEMVENLEAQVIALIDEKQQLVRGLSDLKARMRRIGAIALESKLLEDE